MKIREVLFIILVVYSFILFGEVVESEKQRIIVGSEPDYPPYCLVDDNGEASGFSIDLMDAAAKAVGLDCEFRIDLWGKLKNDLAQGEIDALPMVGRTPEREHIFDFTFPYISLHGAIFIRRGDTSIKSREDLRGKEILVMEGDNAEEFVRRVKLSQNIVTTSTFPAAFKLLAQGKHDAVISQRVMGLQLINELKIKSIVPLAEPLEDFRQDFCFAVQEGDKELLAKLNEGLSIIISDGTFNKIKQKWFTPTMFHTVTIWERVKMIIYILIPIIIITFITLYLLMRSEVKRKTAALRAEIDERLEIHRRLEESEKKFRNYIDFAPAGIVVADEKGKYIDVNRTVTQMTGYTREELLELGISSITADEDKERSYKAFQDLKKNQYMASEFGFVKKSGERRFWEVFAVKLSENRFLGFSLDITDKKKAQEKLRENMEQLQFLFDNMNSGFAYHKIVLDEHGEPVDYIFLDVNSAFEELVGVKKQEIIGKRVTAILPGTKDDPADWIGKYGKVALNGEAIKFKNYSNDVGKWFSVRAYSPQKGYFATIFEDITSQKIAEEKLKKYQEDLENLVKERTHKLEESNKELQRYNELFIGREFRIKELRDRVTELENKLRNR
jgi:PAS domain S-box-containing protein